MLLSNRMRAVANLVQPCESIADIGCDHGYVSIELVESGICGHVIAMDINKGPLERAFVNIHEHSLEDKIEIRQSNGLKSLKPQEAEGIICAGMGGKLIISILEESKELVADMKQLILQPQSEIDEVRYYLRSNGYVTQKEDIVIDDGKYYPMMMVIKTEDVDSEETIIKCIYDKYGRYLLEMSHPILYQYLLKQKFAYIDIRDNIIMQENYSQRQLDRIRELDQMINDIEFCINNYYKQ